MANAGYLGLDIGGTGAKAAVYDRQGRRLGAGHVTFAPIASSDDAAEIPIELIYAAARDATREAVRESSAMIVALSLATQGQTFVVLDASDRPLYPAILWYDSRASAEARQMMQDMTALPLSHDAMPYIEAIAVAPKILWLRRHRREIMATARRYLLLPDYFSYQLTGQAVTDPCTASTTALFADGSEDYSDAALSVAGIERRELARVQPTGTRIGFVTKDIAEEWGLSAATLVVTGTNDQYAGALGAGNCRAGILTETTGTCLALVSLFTDECMIEPAKGLMVGRFPLAGYRHALAYAKTAGLVIEWFSRQFAAGKSLPDLEKLAASEPVGSNGITVLPHFDGMVSPVPDMAVRGALINLTLGSTVAGMYRAVLESIAFSLRENIELMSRRGFSFTAIRSIGGGAASDLLLQIKADVIGMDVERPVVTEAATLGAAMLAATGAGEFASVADCSAAFYRIARVYHADAESHAAYERPFHAYQEAMHRLYPAGV